MELVFEWDTNKAKENISKHQIDFDEAKTIFNDPLLLTFPDDEHSETEERLISIGVSTLSKILLVVHTEREIGEQKIIIRIISCRKATTLERRRYEEGED